jgi:hypothetical protein
MLLPNGHAITWCRARIVILCPRNQVHPDRQRVGRPFSIQDLLEAGHLLTQDAPSLPIEAFIHNTIVTDPVEWEAYIAQVREHPNKEDLRNARAYALQVLSKCWR